MLKVLIADDHEIVRRETLQPLAEGYDVVHMAEAIACAAFVEKAPSRNWDIEVADISIPVGGGLEALKQIKESRPSLPVLILSIYPEEQYAFKVMKAGASGYLTKDAAPEELVNAVSKITSGDKYISNGMVEGWEQKSKEDTPAQLHEMLREREMEVFRLLASGKSISDTGKQLLLQSTTVSTYRTRILVKMGMKTNADLTRYALDKELI